MKNKKTIFIEIGGHSVHDKFAKTVADKHIKITDKIPKDFDYYIVEGSYIKSALLKTKLKNKKVITLFPDPRLFNLSIGKTYDLKKEKMVKQSLIKKMVSKFLIKKIDGAICLGKFNSNLFRKFNKKTPLVTSYGFIENKRFEQLKKIKPDLNNQNLLFIGDGPDPYVKGLDLLIKIFKSLQKDFPSLKLNILGRNWKIKPDWKTPGITFHGRTDIVLFLKKSSLTIHLGRGEGFGLNVVESMAAGVPVLTSKYTGAKEVVKEWNSSFILPLNEKLIIKKITDYFNLSKSKKISLTKNIKKPTLKFKEDKMLKDFKKQYEKLKKLIS